MLDTPTVLGTFVATPAAALAALAAAAPLAPLVLMRHALKQRKKRLCCHATQRLAFLTVLLYAGQQYYCCTPDTTVNTTVRRCVCA